MGFYWIKYKSNGEVDTYKAIPVAKGFAQQEGINYDETFAPTAKWKRIRTVINLAAQNGWKLHQMDVKSAFLNGDLKEEVFMTQPQGFEVEGQEHKVCKLKKALYVWNKLLELGMQKLMNTFEKLVFNEVNLMILCIFECKTCDYCTLC